MFVELKLVAERYLFTNSPIGATIQDSSKGERSDVDLMLQST